MSPCWRNIIGPVTVYLKAIMEVYRTHLQVWAQYSTTICGALNDTSLAIYIVDSEIFARILFSRTALEDIL